MELFWARPGIEKTHQRINLLEEPAPVSSR